MEKAGLVALMMIWCVIGAASAADYKVGESSGWAMGPDYSNWASDKTFNVGDKLIFNYASGHIVDEVSESDYKSCTTDNAINSDSSGDTTITLKTAGTHYYICGVPNHCNSGMKLAVTVAAAAAPPTEGGTKTSPSGTTASPTTTTSPPFTTTTSPTPPAVVTSPTRGTATEQPSSSATFSPSAAVLFSFVFAVVKHFLV